MCFLRMQLMREVCSLTKAVNNQTNALDMNANRNFFTAGNIAAMRSYRNPPTSLAHTYPDNMIQWPQVAQQAH